MIINETIQNERTRTYGLCLRLFSSAFCFDPPSPCIRWYNLQDVEHFHTGCPCLPHQAGASCTPSRMTSCSRDDFWPTTGSCAVSKSSSGSASGCTGHRLSHGSSVATRLRYDRDVGGGGLISSLCSMSAAPSSFLPATFSFFTFPPTSSATCTTAFMRFAATTARAVVLNLFVGRVAAPVPCRWATSAVSPCCSYGALYKTASSGGSTCMGNRENGNKKRWPRIQYSQAHISCSSGAYTYPPSRDTRTDSTNQAHYRSWSSSYSCTSVRVEGAYFLPTLTWQRPPRETIVLSGHDRMCTLT